MKTPALTFVVMLILTAAFGQQVKTGSLMAKQWETGPGLKVPESVLYDAATGIIFVSNVDGDPSVKDNNGFISTLSIGGKILKANWVTGIDAPKGMGILHNHLFVSNIDEVVEIDISKAAIIKRYPVEGSEFLNDIAADPKTGKIFITDSGSGKVYVLLNGKVSIWLQGRMYKGANGLFLSDNFLYIGTGNSILRAEIKSGKVEVSVSNTGGVDGLYVTSEGKFIFSDWKGSVFVAGANSKPELLLNTSAQNINAADFGIVLSKKMILIPTFTDNKVVSYKSSLIK
jgi:DNA-binding beta-propeller fold protein YncE